MNLLFSCIGKRGYIADFFREHLSPEDRIIGSSNTPWTPGFRHCDKSYILPDIASDEYIPAVKEVCRLESISAILSFFDPDTAALSRHIEEFRALGVVPVMPSAPVCETCFDKYQTFLFLRKHRIQTAMTYKSVAEALAGVRSGQVRYPLYVKPRFGFASRNTLLTRNEKELTVFFQLEEQMLVQECLVGEAFNFDMLSDLESRVVSVVVWRKLLSRMGETERAITFRDQNLVQFGVELGTLLGNVGPLDADLFVKDGSIYVLELNPRFGGGYPTSHLAGADFPALIVQMLRGIKVRPRIGQFTDHVVMMKDNNVMGGPEHEFFSDLNITQLEASAGRPNSAVY